MSFGPRLATFLRPDRRLLREDALFSRPFEDRNECCCCSRVRIHAIWTVDVRRRLLAFSRHPRSMQLGLFSGPYRPRRPSRSLRSDVKDSMRPWSRRGDSNSWLPHYALNVARLPFRHFGAKTDLIRVARSRPGDSNPGPAVYETAALPTELGRQAHLCRLSQPNLPCFPAFINAKRSPFGSIAESPDDANFPEKRPHGHCLPEGLSIW